MTPSEIKTKLKEAGYTQTKVAKKCTVSVVLVHNVIKGIAVSARIRQEIAKIIKVDAGQIWPTT